MKLYVSILPAQLINSEVGADVVDQCVNLFRRLEKYAGGRFKAEDFLISAAQETSYIFIVCNEDAVVLSAVSLMLKKYPRKTCLEITAISGFNGKYWADDLTNQIFHFAKGNGINTIEVPHYRRGWVRVLSKYGFKETFLGLEAAVDGKFTAIDVNPEG